jgi:hypothetical protein
MLSLIIVSHGAQKSRNLIEKYAHFKTQSPPSDKTHTFTPHRCALLSCVSFLLSLGERSPWHRQGAASARPVLSLKPSHTAHLRDGCLLEGYVSSLLSRGFTYVMRVRVRVRVCVLRWPLGDPQMPFFGVHPALAVLALLQFIDGPMRMLHEWACVASQHTSGHT